MVYSMNWEQAVQWLRAQPEYQSLVRNCYFDDPLVEAARRYADSDEWKAVREWLPKKAGTALDIGAGRGISSYALARNGWQVTALEPDPSSVVGGGAIASLAAQSGYSVKVVQRSAETSQFDDCTFDLVYGRQVLHHASNLDELCKQSYRVLKPGGRFIATREHVISKHSDLNIFLDNHPLHKLYGGENAYLLKEYVSAISKNGFKIINIMGPFDSVINLFPSNRQDIGANLVGKILGRKVASFLVNERHCVGRVLLDVMCDCLSRFYDLPGRLYSFVAERPSK